MREDEFLFLWGTCPRAELLVRMAITYLALQETAKLPVRVAAPFRIPPSVLDWSGFCTCLPAFVVTKHLF